MVPSLLGNSLDDCYPTGALTVIQKSGELFLFVFSTESFVCIFAHPNFAGFKNYKSFSWLFFLALLGACVVSHLASVIFGRIKDRRAAEASSDDAASPEVSERDKHYALNTIGADSVFSFFLTKKVWGWVIALITMATQLWMCFVFVEGSEFTFPIPVGSMSDLVYTFKCSRDEDDCRDTNGMGDMFCCFCYLSRISQR